jgi:putative acetyltransferase
VLLRLRVPADDAAIAYVTDAAFGSGREARLILALRESGAAAIELVAIENAEIVGLGHPRYYPRFGFSAAQASHLEAPYSGEAFMALALRLGVLDGRHGRVVYPSAFSIVN